jgi:hypothetical protein
VICQAVYRGTQSFCPIDGGAIVEPDADEDPYVGRTIDGRYLVHRRIGRGGMGVVYEAVHVGLDKRVALKFLLGASDADALARFRREARIASKIDHGGRAHEDRAAAGDQRTGRRRRARSTEAPAGGDREGRHSPEQAVLLLREQRLGRDALQAVSGAREGAAAVQLPRQADSQLECRVAMLEAGKGVLGELRARVLRSPVVR